VGIYPVSVIDDGYWVILNLTGGGGGVGSTGTLGATGDTTGIFAASGFISLDA
jgi:hypothetical protein